MRKKVLSSAFVCFYILVLYVNTNAQNRNLRFDTKMAMYAANEEWLTFACEVPDGVVNLDIKHQSDMYWYSLYNMGNLTLRSGMGIHIVSNPLFAKHAREDTGMPWGPDAKGMQLMRQRTFMQHKVAQFKAKSGAAHLDNMFAGYDPPTGAFPVYLEYASGIPTFQTDPNLEDFGTLRWDEKSFDKTLNPGAWGQTLMKQILWSRDFFTVNRTFKGTTFIGTGAYDGAHGFRGSMLIAMAMAKSYALKSTLAYHAKTKKLGAVNPATYDPMNGAIYYPHAYKAKMGNPMRKMMLSMMKAPPTPTSFAVTDPTSDLFDVASLLWGESEFYYLTDPKIKDGFDELFGDPKWMVKGKSEAEIDQALAAGKTVFPSGNPHQLSMGMTVVNFKNIMGLHFNKQKGSLVDTWHPEKGKGNHISTDNAGMAMVALANTYHRLHDVEKVRNGAKMLLIAQAKFLVNHQSGDGSIANGFTLGDKVIADDNAKSLQAQAFAIRGWLAAYQITKDKQFLDAAEKAYNFIQLELWSESAQVYRTSVGATQSTYNGLNYGAVLGAMRELAIAKEGVEREEVTDRLDQFFVSVTQKGGLQIAEINMTGEMIPSPEKAMQMMAQMEELKAKDPQKAKKMQMKMMDSDNDGIPKPKFVMGTKHGAAPVTAGRITLITQ